MTKSFQRHPKTWEKSIKPGLNVATVFISAAVGANTKGPQLAQRTNKILKTINGRGFYH